MSFADWAELPPIAVTMTSTVPMVPVGATAMICVAELTVKLLAVVPPKETAETPAKNVPVMTTEVPPLARPAFGLTDETVAAPT